MRSWIHLFSKMVWLPALAGLILLFGGCAFPLTPPPLPATEEPGPSPTPLRPTPTAEPLPTQISQQGLVLESVVLTPAPTVEGMTFRRFEAIDGELALETEHLRIYVEDGFMPLDLEEFGRTAETIYAYVAQRMQTTTPVKFDLALRPPDPSPCPIRGLAISYPEPQTVVFADETTSPEQIQGVLAHELAHLLHAHGLQAGGDRFLTEGLATWAAGDYWQAWQGRAPNEQVKAFLKEGTYRPLPDFYRQAEATPVAAEDCLSERDNRYVSWAAFIGYLIDEYGLPRFVELLGPSPERAKLTDSEPETTPSSALVASPTPPRRDGPPDFEGVYGLALNQLEDAWLRRLMASGP